MLSSNNPSWLDIVDIADIVEWTEILSLSKMKITKYAFSILFKNEWEYYCENTWWNYHFRYNNHYSIRFNTDIEIYTLNTPHFETWHSTEMIFILRVLHFHHKTIWFFASLIKKNDILDNIISEYFWFNSLVMDVKLY